MLCFGRIHISSGFILLCAVSYYFDETGVLLFVLLGACIHELGHYFAIRLSGGDIEAVHLSLFGAEMRMKSGRGLTPWQEIVISLAGPSASLLAAGISVFAAEAFRCDRLYFFAGANALLGLFNLLPAGCFDGGRAVYFFMLGHTDIQTALRIQTALTAVMAAIFICAGILVFIYSGYNLSVLAISGYLTYGLAAHFAGGRPGTCKKRRLHVK